MLKWTKQDGLMFLPWCVKGRVHKIYVSADVPGHLKRCIQQLLQESTQTVSQLTTRISKMKEQRKKVPDSQIFHCVHYTNNAVKMAKSAWGCGTG